MRGVGGVLRLEKGVEGDGIGGGGKCGATIGGEGDDAIPALRHAHDTLQAGAAAVAEGASHDVVGGHHEVFDEVHGPVLDDFAEVNDLAVGDDGVGLDTLEVEGAGGSAGGAEVLGGLVLQAELIGEPGGVGGWLREVGCTVGAEGEGVGCGAGGVLEPGADARVGQLGAVADGGAGDLLVWKASIVKAAVGWDGEAEDGGDIEAHHEGGAIGVFVEGGEAGRELDGQHGEVLDGGIDGLGLGGGVEVERAALGNGGGDVGDGDVEADACLAWESFGVPRSGRGRGRCRYRWRTRGGCAGRGCWLGRCGGEPGGEVVELGHGGRGELRVEAGGVEVVEGCCGEVEAGRRGLGGHGRKATTRRLDRALCGRLRDRRRGLGRFAAFRLLRSVARE